MGIHQGETIIRQIQQTAHHRDYIVDFVCIEKKLVIEVDGGYHSEYEQIEKDENRTLRLHDWGFNVIRFKNEDILRDISSVLEIIKINLNNGNE